MPVYDFNCPAHGAFSDRLGYEASRAGARCPRCGAPSPVLPALPQVSTLSSALRRAETRAESSSGAPRVVKRAHLPSCGCNLCSKKPPASSRRWMLGQC